MSVPAVLQTEDGARLHTETVGPHTHIIVEDHARVATQFKSLAFTDAATATLVTPPKGTAMVMTDFTVSAEKLTGGSVSLRFTDGTDTVIIFTAIVTDAPVNLTFSPAGRWRGWRDARMEIVSVGNNIDGAVSMGYYFIRGEAGVLSFADWDALR